MTKVTKEVRFTSIPDPRGEDYGFGLYYVPGEGWILASNAGVYCTSDFVPELTANCDIENHCQLMVKITEIMAAGAGDLITPPEEGERLDEAHRLMMAWGWIELPPTKKIRVRYEGGESRTHPGKAVDFMIATVPTEDGDIELYAEADPVEGDALGTHEELSRKILAQAAAHGIDVARLEFFRDPSNWGFSASAPAPQPASVAFALFGEEEQMEDYERVCVQYCVPFDEIENVICLEGMDALLLDGAKTCEEARLLIDGLSAEIDECETAQDIVDLLDEKAPQLRAREPKEYESADDTVVYFFDEDEVSVMALLDPLTIYRYLDAGSNWQTITLDIEPDFVECEADYEDLDEWDERSSSNCYQGVQWTHGRLYKVVRVNGKKVSETFLVREDSDWQGSIPVARLVDESELATVRERARG